MTLRRISLVLACLSSMAWQTSAGHAEGIKGMLITGYADRLSVQPGEVIRFMVSAELPTYRAEIVRLIHGDPNPKGPGVKEEIVEAPVNKEYAGRHQDLPNGSYVIVPDSPALRRTGSFTIQAWIAPSTPTKGLQGIVTKWAPSDGTGYGLFVDDGTLGLWLGEKNGQVQKVRAGRSLRASIPANVWPGGHQMVNTTTWYFVAASFDASSGKVVLYQETQTKWPLEDTEAVVEKVVSLKSLAANDVPLLIGATWDWHEAGKAIPGGYYNGKIENPRLFDRSLSRQEVEALKGGTEPTGAVAAWDFSRDISSRKVSDASANQLHGRTVNMPTRAITGHNWKAYDDNYRQVPQQYGAIHFHDDDLDDAAWKADFEYRVPLTLKSGVYAARLRAGSGEDYVPFFVRPKKGTATSKIAFLAPTFTYLAYDNSNIGVPRLLSLYSYHSDGSGVCYSSRLRPILTARPKVVPVASATGLRNPGGAGGFNADLFLIDWMEAKGFTYDVISDEDLHAEGAALLKPYKVVVTGAHPEYWSGPMLDGMKSYLEDGGRLMYLGGNGFYWVTSMDPEEKHTVEVRRRDGTETWEAAPGEYYHSTTGEFGGVWRFRGRPPQQLVGVGFTAQGGSRGVPFKRQPGSFDARASWIFDGIGADELIGNGPSLSLEFGAAGHEVDRLDVQLGTPPNTLLLATTLTMSDGYQHVVEEVLQSDSHEGGTVNPWVKGDIVLVEYPHGGAVFSSSSITWDGSLSYNAYNNAVSRVTENVLKKFSLDVALPGARPSGQR